MTQLLVLQFTQTAMPAAFFECLTSLSLDWHLVQASQAAEAVSAASAILLPPEAEAEFLFLNAKMQFAKTQSALHEAAKQGKLILGMGLGGRILVEWGLVPGIENDLGQPVKAMSLARGEKGCDAELHSDLAVGFELIESYQRNQFTQTLPEGALFWAPLATRWGRFVVTPALDHEIQNQGMAVFQSVSKARCDLQFQSELKDRAVSDNPFGVPSYLACCNKQGNVMASVLDFSKSTLAKALLSALAMPLTKDINYYDAKLPLFYFPVPRGLGTYVLDQSHILHGVNCTEQDKKALSLQDALWALGYANQVSSCLYVKSKGDLKTSTLANGIALPLSQPHLKLTKRWIFLLKDQDEIEQSRRYQLLSETMQDDMQSILEMGEYLCIDMQIEMDFFSLLKYLELAFGFDPRLQTIDRILL